ncbi:MAG: hypothetical protein NW241_12715 [Bacteroidia bacterium]|nr:hypothetical protein [Bacteroidia bacterium]
MKHGLFAAVLLFGSCCSLLSQTGNLSQVWFEYPFDPVLTVVIPDQFERLDTLGSKRIFAATEYGAITVVSMPFRTRMLVQSEQALHKAYASFQSGFVNSQPGLVLANSETVRIGALTGIRFLLREEDETLGRQGHYLCLLVNGKMYVVSFLEEASMTEAAAADRERLFASILLPKGLTISSQMTAAAPGGVDPASGGVDPAAYLAGRITGIVIVLLILLFAAVRIWGRPWNRPDPVQ